MNALLHGNETAVEGGSSTAADFESHYKQSHGTAAPAQPGPRATPASGSAHGKQHKTDFFAQATTDRVLEVPVNLIKIASDNEKLYDRFAIDNNDDWDLRTSIKEHGIQEALVISNDGILLSGHRRLAAAQGLRLKTVPARVADVDFYRLSDVERLRLLRLYNQQRDKSPGERIREALATIDRVSAYNELLWHRSGRNVVLTKANVQLGGAKKRARITTIGFLHAVQRVIQENEPYWPLTDRRVHYLLLNDPPLRHDNKPGSRYRNDKKSYKAVTNLLIRARLAGLIPMEAIDDPTRPIQLGGGFDSVEQFVADEVDGFLRSFARNLMQGQLRHVEIVLEKKALRTVIEEVAREFCIPMTTVGGYSSLPPRTEISQRFKRSGKSKLVLLMLTDFDPDGDQIAASFARSMRDDFGIYELVPVKVALTAEDVQEHDFPSDMDAKPSSPNYKKFVARHGTTRVVELDAAPVEFLQEKLRDAIEGVIDMDEFKRQVEQEKADAASIEAHRRVVFEAIKSAKTP